MVKRSVKVLAGITGVMLLLVFFKIQFIGKNLEPAAFEKYLLASTPTNHQVKLSFLGTSGFILEHHGKQLVMDPFFSNPNLLSTTFGRVPFPALSPYLDSNLYQHISLVTISHGHYDHCLDIRQFLKPGMGTTVVADRGILNQLDPVWQEDQVQTRPAADAWIYDADSSFRVYTLPSTHSPHIGNITLMSGTYNTPLHELPAKLWNWKLCACNSYLVDVLDSGRIVYRALMCTGNMNPEGRERLKSLCKEHHTDIMMSIFWKREQCWDNLIALHAIAKPKDILLHHWNNFFRSNHKRMQYLRPSDLPQVLNDLEKQGIPAKIMLPFTTVEL